jgi:hypothetical protein
MPAPPAETFSYDPVPHPRFSADGRYLIYTTTVMGRIDVAIVPLSGLPVAHAESASD